MYPYAVTIGIPRGERAMQGVVLKGVDSTYDWSFFRQNLVEGELPDVQSGVRTKDIAVSRSLADLLEVSVGDPLEMLFIQDPPRRDLFRVAGIYDTQFSEIDHMMVLTDLRNVQRLNGWDSTQITGFEIATSDFGRLEPFTDDVYQVVFDNLTGDEHDSLRVINIRERFPMIFDWLDAHNVNAGVIITVMLLVALFNMIAALLIILLERTSMIGTLKALGMGNRALQKMFSDPLVVRHYKRNVLGQRGRHRPVSLTALHRMDFAEPGGIFPDHRTDFHRLGVAGAAECRDLPVHCSAAGFADDDNFTNFAGENDPLRIVPNDETL